MHRKLKKQRFGNFFLTFLLKNIYNEEELKLLIEEKVNHKNFRKSETEIETYQSMEESKFTQDYNSDQRIVIIKVNLNAK